MGFSLVEHNLFPKTDSHSFVPAVYTALVFSLSSLARAPRMFWHMILVRGEGNRRNLYGADRLC
jgi:hypothetical protein